MGLQLDLCSMLGIPNTCQCPTCHNTLDLYFDDFDLESSNSIPSPGTINLTIDCDYGATIKISAICAGWQLARVLI